MAIVIYSLVEGKINTVIIWCIGDNWKTCLLVNAKRLIGRKFNDSFVQSDAKHWPFKIVKESTVAAAAATVLVFDLGGGTFDVSILTI